MNILRQARALLTQALLPAVVALAVLGLVPTAQGQTQIFKTNNTTNGLTTTAAWTNSTTGAGGNPAAVNGSEVGVIDNTVMSGSTFTYSATLNLGGLLMKNPAGAIIIQPGSAQTFNLGNGSFVNGGGIDMSNSTQSLTLGTNNNLVLQNGQAWNVGNGTIHPTLTVNGPINNNGMSLYLGGNGTVDITGVVSGTGAIWQNNTGTLTLSANNTMTGGVSLNSGTLILTGNGTSATNSALGTGVFGIGGSGTNTLNVTGPTSFAGSTNNVIQLDNGFTFTGTSTLNMGTGNVLLGNNLSNNLTLTISASTLTLGGVIADGGVANTNGAGLIKAGAGTLVLGGANTFGGIFALTGGTLTLSNSLALQNAVLTMNTAGTTLSALPATSTTLGGLSGNQNIALPAGAYTLNINPAYYANSTYNGTFNTTYNGTLSGAAGLVVFNGAGNETFNGTNTYAGGTQIKSGTVIVGGTGNTTAWALGTGAINITGGTLDATGGAVSNTLTTPNTLTFGGSFTFTGSNNLNLGTGAVTLTATPTITVNASTLTVGGVISGATFGITKAGNGTLSLTNAASTYSGVTTINGGTISVLTLANGAANSGIGNPGAAGSASSLVFNGGTLQWLGTTGQTTDRLFTVGSGGATIDNSGTNSLGFTNTTGSVAFTGTNINTTLTFTGGNISTNNLFDPIISNNGTGKTSVTKSGVGEWVLNAINTYTGNTTLTAGTLALKNAAAIGSGNLVITGGSLDNTNATMTLTNNNAQFYNGNWTFVGSQQLNMGTGAVTLGANVTLTTTASTLTIGGAIGDGGNSFSLTKAGAGGTLVLNNSTGTFSGNMNMQAGTLTIGGNLTLQNATLNNTGGTTSFTQNNATIAGLAGSTAMTLPITNLTIATNNGNTTSPTFANLTYSGILSGTGQVILSGCGTENFSGANTYTGGTMLNGGTLGINNSGVAGTSSAIGKTGALTFNGGNIDNTSGSAVSVLTNNPITINSSFIFYGTNSLNLGTGAVTLSAGHANYQITINGSTLTIGGAITGTASLEMLGNSYTASDINSSRFGGGTLVLSGANSGFSGGVIVDAGLLQINNANALGTGTFTLNGGSFDSLVAATTLTNNNAQIYEANVTFAGTNSLNMGTGAVTLSGSPTFSITANTLTIGGLVRGTSGLTLNGQGTLALTNASSNYTLGTTINGGTLQVSTLALGNAISSIGNSSASALNLSINGGTLQLISGVASQTTDRLFTIGTNGATIDASSATAGNIVTWSGSGALALPGSNSNVTLTLTGNSGTTTTFNTFDPIIGNDGTGKTSVVKSGSGEWVLNAANTYSGGTTIAAGTLGLKNLGTTSANSSVGTGAITFAGGNIDNNSGSAGTLSTNNALNFNNSLTFVGTNALNLGTGAGTLGANVTLTTTASTLTIGGAIGDNGSGYSLSKAGAGTLVLSAANTYSGNTNVSAGTLLIGNSLSLQNSMLNITGGAFSFGTNTTTANNTLSAATLGGLNGTVALALGNTTTPFVLTLNPGAGVTGNYNAVLSDSATVGDLTSVVISGKGTQEFSGQNTYGGTTTVDSGTLMINNSGTAGTGSAIGKGELLMSGGNLDVGGAIVLATNNTMALNNSFTFVGSNSLNMGTGNVSLGSGVVINVAGSTLTIGGHIGGDLANGSTSNSLTKAGGGTLVLAGANNFTGATTVKGGTLQLNLSGGSNIINSASALAMNGGTLLINGSASNAQTFASTAFNMGASVFSGNQNGAANLTINLGPVTRAIGGTVDFTLPTTGNINGTLSGSTAWTAPNKTIVDANGISYATVGLTNWANLTSNATVGRVTALATYSANVTGVAGNFTSSVNDLMTANTTAAPSASGSLNTLTFGGGASTLNIGATTLSIVGGGILQSANATAADTISSTAGGVLTGSAGTGSELVIIIGNATAADGLTISANIANNGGNALAVTKSGPGNLSLTGANSYSNGTYLNSGILTLGNNGTSTANSAIGTGKLIINGGTLDVSGARSFAGTTNNTMAWNGNFTFAGSNTLNMGTGAVTMGANIALTTGGSTLTIGGAIGDGASGYSLTKLGGTGTLVLSGNSTYSGGTILSAGTLDINANGTSTTNSAIGTGALTISGGTIDNTSGGAISLAATTNNTLNVNSSFTFTGSNSLNFGTGNVALGLAPTITVSGSTLTMGGIIGGNLSGGESAFGITKAGGGTLALTGNNVYNGGTTLSAGTLILSGSNSGTGNTTVNAGTLDINQSGNATASALGTGTLVLAAGATIDNTSGGTVTIATKNNVNINGSFTYTGGSQSLNLGTGNVALSVTPTITVSGNTLTLGGVISGAFGITKAGSGGTLVLGGNNTFTGAVTVSGGTLVLAANNALGVNAAGTSVASGATLQLNDTYKTGSGTSSSTGSMLTINGAGAGGTTGGALLNSVGNATWDGNITLGSSSTISAGAGSGGSTVETLTIGNSSAYNGLLASNTTGINIGSNTLTFKGGANTVVDNFSNITGSGQVVVDTQGTVHFEGFNYGYTGATSVLNGTLIADGQTNSDAATQGQGWMTIPSTQLTIGGALGTANTAIVQLSSTGAGGDATNVMNDQINVSINPTGWLKLYGQTQQIANLTMNAGYVSTAGTAGSSQLVVTGVVTTLANPITALIDGNLNMVSSTGNSITTFNIAAGTNATSDFTVAANLTGGSVFKTGAGIMTFSNTTNAYTGSTEVSTGTLVITASGALGANNNSAGEGTQVDAGAQLRLVKTGSDIAVGTELLTINGNGNGTGVGDGALQNVSGTNNSWAGTVIAATNATINTAASSNLTLTGCVGTTNLSTSSTLTFNGNGNTTLSGNVYGGLSMVKNGTGTLLMNGSIANNFNGTTTVNAGTLELNAASSTAMISNTNTLTVNSGGTLLTDTSGQLNLGVKMVLNGGTWATNALGSTNASPQGTFTESLNTLTLTANSNITLGANSNTLNFAGSAGTNWTPGQVLYINNWTGDSQLDGSGGGGGTDEIFFGTTAGGLGGTSYTGQLGEIIFVNPQDPTNGLSGTSGNFHAVILSTGEVVPFLATPEPSTVAAGAGLGLLALLREWRRRKNRLAANLVK